MRSQCATTDPASAATQVVLPHRMPTCLPTSVRNCNNHWEKSDLVSVSPSQAPGTGRAWKCFTSCMPVTAVHTMQDWQFAFTTHQLGWPRILTFQSVA